MTTTLDRNEVQEIYGMLDLLAKEQGTQGKRLSRVENDVKTIKDDVKAMKRDLRGIKTLITDLKRRL